MPQLHLYVSDAVAEALRQRAEARGLPVSRYLAEIVSRDIDRGWPDGFFDNVAGSWGDEEFEVPDDGPPEERPDL